MNMFDASDSHNPDTPVAVLASRILVVVPTLNEAEHIETTIRALLTGEVALSSIKIVVVDGGSTDATREIVSELSQEFPNLTLLENPARLQAAAVNLGAKTDTDERDILVRCDAHADYPVNYVLKVAAALKTHKAESLVVPMDARGRTCFQKANAWIVDTPLGSGGSAHRGGVKSGVVDHGHHAAFDRRRFLSLGGYDETFPHNEDAEYDARLAAAGGRIYLDADIRIGYYPRDDVQGLWQQYLGYGTGRARNIQKNSLTPKLRQMIPVLHVFALVLSAVMLPFSMVGMLWPALYLGMLVAVSIGISVKHRSSCGLLSGLALAVMHLAWGLGFLKGTFRALRKDSQ